MANTKEIQKRMKSIRDTMKITSAMYMISSAKLRSAKQKLEQTEPLFLCTSGFHFQIPAPHSGGAEPLF